MQMVPFGPPVFSPDLIGLQLFFFCLGCNNFRDQLPFCDGSKRQLNSHFHWEGNWISGGFNFKTRLLTLLWFLKLCTQSRNVTGTTNKCRHIVELVMFYFVIEKWLHFPQLWLWSRLQLKVSLAFAVVPNYLHCLAALPSYQVTIIFIYREHATWLHSLGESQYWFVGDTHIHKRKPLVCNTFCQQSLLLHNQYLFIVFLPLQ